MPKAQKTKSKEEVDLELDIHPPILFAYSFNHVDLIVKVKNFTKQYLWCEVDFHLTDRISLNPSESVHKGRMRVGILKPKEYVKRAIKIYANSYTNPQLYPVKVILYAYDKDAAIVSRVEKMIDVRCEIKKKAVI